MSNRLLLLGIIITAAGTSAFAQITNPSFELPTTATADWATVPGWHRVSGDAWEVDNTLHSPADTQTSASGAFWADTYRNGGADEFRIGVIESDPFPLPTTSTVLAMELCGYHDNGHGWGVPLRPNSTSITVHLASTGEMIGGAIPGNHGSFRTAYALLSPHPGELARVRCNDAADYFGYAWLSVDNFRFVPAARTIETFEISGAGGVPAGWNVISGSTWAATDHVTSDGEHWRFKPGAREGVKFLTNGPGSGSGVIESPPITVQHGDIALVWEWCGGASTGGIKIFNAADTGRTSPLATFTPAYTDWFDDPACSFNVQGIAPGTQLVMRITDNRTDEWGWVAIDYIRITVSPPTAAARDWSGLF